MRYVFTLYLLFSVGERYWRKVDISQKSLVKFLNKSTSLQTLSLEEVQLSDMVSPP